MRAVLLVVGLSGCENTIRFPPDLWGSVDSGWRTSGDTGTEREEVPPRQVTVAEASCDPDRTAWTLRARIDGWTREVRINVFRTADATEEEHLMRLVSADPNGAWDQVQSGPLPDATPVADQVPELNTRFDCTADASSLTFVVRVWGEADVLLDCAVWGADAAAATARIRTLDPDILRLGGCRELGS